MRDTIRGLEAVGKWSEAMRVAALEEIVGAQAVTEVVQAAQATRRGRGRCRKLTPTLTLWLAVTLHLFPRHAIPGVLRQLTHGLRLLWPSLGPEGIVLPVASALSYRRYQLGARPLVALFHRVCRPLAMPRTPGAFRFGLRLVGLDGSVENVPDSPANRRAFGCRRSQRGPSVYPQVLGVYLVEIGTHAIFEAGFWPGAASEHPAAQRLVRAVARGMLVLWDRGFHSVALLRAVRARGAHVLGRLPSHVQPLILRHLADGSALAYLRPSGRERGRPEAGLLVRLLSYRVAAPLLTPRSRASASAAPITLVTTLLNPCQAPAAVLAQTYHERWEVEVTLDELATHQRLATRTLRSPKPVGVLQELYGLLVAHYVVRAWMLRAAQHALPDSPGDPDRLSFVHALQVVVEAILDFQVLPPAHWPQLVQRLLADIARGRLPARRPRTNPRVVRRQTGKFPPKAPGQHGTPRQPGTYTERLCLAAPPPVCQSATARRALSRAAAACLI